MATFDAQKSTWTATDVQHFARRAGFGVSPEAAAVLAGQSPATVVDAWVDGTASAAAFQAAIPVADVVSDPARQNIPADPAPHPFRLEPWRGGPGGVLNAQSYFAWRMQYNPNPLHEKLALFWHQLLATGGEKVDNPAFMTSQVDLFRSPTARGPFGALLVAVSQDPAMLVWLDSVQNRVRPGTADIPNENYAREILELYALGVDNGYNQQDITNLAKAFSGWNIVVNAADLVTDPNNANVRKASKGTFRVYRGQANTNPADPRYGANLPNWHATGTVTFLGQSYDIGAPSNYGEALIGQILALNGGANCAQFLAKRLLLFFVNAAYSSQVLADLQALVIAENFHIGNVLKRLFKSDYFFDASHRFALYEGPVAWSVRAARMLGPDLATAQAVTPIPAFSAWRAIANAAFANAGQDLLDPSGPNGWREHDGWINSNSLRFRGKLAAGLALGEALGGSQLLFPTTVSTWFPTPPASAQAVYDRLVALLQPAPIPTTVRDAWLSGLWTGAFTWDTGAATQQKVRELAFLLLNSPQSQLH
jgi:uncharacterized protein (DUF1800 family)